MSWWGQKSESGIVMTKLYYLYSFHDTSCCYNHIQALIPFSLQQPWKIMQIPPHALPCLSPPVPSAEPALFDKKVEETCVHVTMDDL